MLKKTCSTMLLATVFAAGCGGSGGASSGSTNPQAATVPGPLDPVQQAVTTSVIGPLASATANTPVQGVLLCANSVVTQNTLDIADAFANGLASPSTLTATTPEQAQAALSALVANLSGLLTALAGQTSCGGVAVGGSLVPATNPLAGTPLEPLGAALLPALTSAQQQLAGVAGGTAAPLSATQLTSILTLLRDAYAQGVTALPPTATTAPVIGGVLYTVGDALIRLTNISSDAIGSATSTQLAADLQQLTQALLDDLLTKVVPIQTLQDAAGTTAVNDVVAQLEAAVATLTAPLASAPTVPLPTDPFAAVSFSALTDILAKLAATLPTALAGTNGQTPLDVALGTLQTALEALLKTVNGSCLLVILGVCPTT